MTLADLQEHVNRLIQRVEQAGMNPETMNVKIWGERGEPCRIEARHVNENETLTLTAVID